jgi:uncharacterized phage protein (TIGR02218 family)
MTFAAEETSIQSGAPIEHFEFEVGPTVYRYTSAPDDQIYLTKTYDAVQIARSDVDESGDIPKDGITITVPRDAAIADEFRVAPPSVVILVNIYRFHNDDPDGERKLFWTGRVLNCEWKGAIADLTCESIYTALKRPGLRRLYQRMCPHVLYGSACGLNDTAYKSTITLATVAGTTLTSLDIDAQPDGYFAGGMIEWESSPGRFERRGIKSHIGDTVTLTHPVPGLEAGQAVSFWAGCDHSLATCDSKFSNSANYGGFPFVPKKNPFTGTNVF